MCRRRRGEVIGDATFTADVGVANVQVEAEHVANPWGGADLGITAEDNALESVLQSIRHHPPTGYSLPGNDGIHVRLGGLTDGVGYKMQLLFREQGGGGRGFDISVNGSLIADEFSTVSAGWKHRAVVHYFVADGTDVTVHLSGIGASFPDRNPILNGLTCEEVGNFDSDGDGLFDGWEQQYFGNLDQDAGGDPDGDGLDNAAEILTAATNDFDGGTDPAAPPPARSP